MSGQRKTDSKGNKWNKRLLRLAAAAFAVMLLGQIFWPSGENFSVAQDKDVQTEAEPQADGKASENAEVPASGQETGKFMETYYREHYDAGESRAFYADLTHDGQDDLIVLEVRGDTSDYTLEAAVTVLSKDQSGEVRTVYERQMDQSHAGWGWLYLYEENGRDYLVEYDPILYEGVSRYAFSVFSLTPAGQRVQLTGDTLEFDWNGEIGKDLEDQIRALNQKAFGYMDHAQVIAAVGEEYFSGLKMMCELGQ